MEEIHDMREKTKKRSNNFRILYWYECRKILGKKLVWFSLLAGIAIMTIGLLSPLFGGYYIDGKYMGTTYEMYLADRDYAKELSGRKIDQTLLEETMAAYKSIPYTPEIHYTATEEYQKIARPYSEIFNFVRQTSGIQTSELILSWQPDEKDLYAKRQIWLMSLWKDLGLSQGEMDFWRAREEQVETPYVYEEHGGYSTMFSFAPTVGFVVLMLTAICLSGIFTEEHTRKTDQLVLCSPLGKTTLYQAKIAAGISFAAFVTVLFSALIWIGTICLYGMEGFQAALQFLYAQSSAPVTCGQAVLITYGIIMITAIITSVFVMVLSELLQNNIATLAISSGLLMLSMAVVVPEQYRVLAQIWTWLPWSFFEPWNVFGSYTVSLLGHYFTPWQAVPVIYLVSAAAIAAVGKPVYQRYQVSGR